MKKLLLILSIISALFLAGCNTNENEVVNNDKVENENSFVGNEDLDAEIHKLQDIKNSVPKFKYDSNKEIVYTFYEREKVSFPYININNEKIYKLNEEIYNWAMPVILGACDTCKSLGDSYNDSAEYKYYLNGDVLTVIISDRCNYGGSTGFFLNIDIKTGNSLSNTEILQKNGVKIRNFSNLREKIFGSKDSLENFKEYLKSVNGGDITYYDNILANPMEWELVYFDNEQKMHVIIELPGAGATDAVMYYDYLVELEENELLDLKYASLENLKNNNLIPKETILEELYDIGNIQLADKTYTLKYTANTFRRESPDVESGVEEKIKFYNSDNEEVLELLVNTKSIWQDYIKEISMFKNKYIVTVTSTNKGDTLQFIEIYDENLKKVEFDNFPGNYTGLDVNTAYGNYYSVSENEIKGICTSKYEKITYIIKETNGILDITIVEKTTEGVKEYVGRV